jgi:hypothetical protein
MSAGGPPPPGDRPTPGPSDATTAPGAATPPADGGAENATSASTGGKIDRLRVIGGLVALFLGLLAIIVVVIVALIVKPDTTGGGVATSAIGVVGSMVGAYFGVKIGSDGTQQAVKAQQEEATKAQVFALHTPPEAAQQALDHATALIKAQGAPTKK